MKPFCFSIVLFNMVLSQTYMDPNISNMDTQTCNTIFPFVFAPGNSNPTIVDWDLQNFADNYSQFTASTTSNAVTQESYIAMAYREAGSLFVGVTY